LPGIKRIGDRGKRTAGFRTATVTMDLMIIIPTKGTILIEDQQAATLPGLLRCSSTIISKHPYLCQGVFEETLLQEHDF